MQRRSIASGLIARCAAIVLVVGCTSSEAPSQSASQGSTPIPTTAATPTPVASPTEPATPMPTADAGSISWTSVGHIPGSPITLRGGPLGLFAAGEDEDSGSLAVWRSTDGAKWKRVSVEGDGRIFDFALGGTPLVAVGCTRCSSDGDPIKAAAWTSRDGSSWHLVPLHDQPTEVTGVVDWHGGFVAVEEHSDPSGGNGCNINARRSEDGATWSAPVHIDDGCMSAPLSATPDALVVLTKSIWTSDDGRRWSRAAPGPTHGNVKFWMLAGPGRRLVAFGQECHSDADVGAEVCRATFATSTDGASWTEAPAAPDMSSWVASHVDWFGDGVVAVGSALDGPAVVAESRDGLTWMRGGFPSYESMTGLAAVGDTMYAVDVTGQVWAGTRT
jgi:hypothetical protein